MNLASTTQLIIEYRYAILLPLALIEGPIVAFVSGTLASLGYFNIFGLALFFFARDMAMDALYYYLGYFGGRTGFARRLLKKVHVTEDHLEGVRLLWEHHPLSTMFIGKLSYGIGSTFVAVAGMVKMRVMKFFKYGAFVAIVHYWTLLALGYFFGNSFGGSISNILSNFQYVVAAVGVVITIYYIFSWRMRRKFLEESEEEEGKKDVGTIL